MAEEGTENESGSEVAPAADDVASLKAALAKANDDAKRHRLRNKELEPLAAKAQELEDANRSELEKATARAEAAERERDEATAQSLRAQVAADKGVPAASLTGSTKEELEAKADELIAWRDAEKKPKPKTPVGQLKSGASGDAEHTGRERAAAALRQLRGTT